MSVSASVQAPNRAIDAAADSGWGSLYRMGGLAALVAVLVSLLEIVISFAGGDAGAGGTLTAAGWFGLLQDNGFLGLRNLGLFNIIGMALAVPTYLALYGAHRRANRAQAALAAILLFMGAAIYIANNKALAMLALSGQYAAATTEAQRSLYAAAGQAMLAQAEDFAPGAFMGFLFPTLASILMGTVLLRGRVFGRWTAWAAILGPGFLLVFTICATLVPALFAAVMILALIGGLLSMAANILIALRLFQLGRFESEATAHGQG